MRMKHSRDGMAKAQTVIMSWNPPGKQAVGWLHLNDGTYYFDDNGAMVFGWQEIDSFRYYFGTDGRMVSGEQTIDDVSYNFQEDGKLLTGWTGDFLYDEHGFAVTEQYIEIKDGKYVYVD